MGLALLALSTAAAETCVIPESWTAMVVEQPQPSTIALKLPPTPVKIGEPFTVDILVCADQQPETGSLKLDATMPAHRHGMNYKPEIQPVADNIYRVSGMFFHMPGEWQITVDLLSDDIMQRFFLKVPAR